MCIAVQFWINFKYLTTTKLEDLPDLIPNATELQSSIVLEDRPLYKLKCALEENCLSKTSYNTERDQFGNY